MNFQLAALSAHTEGEGLKHAIAHSLLTNAQAQPWQLEKYQQSHPQGWWAVQPYAQTERGSLLWLFARAKNHPKTIKDLKIQITSALQWLPIQITQILIDIRQSRIDIHLTYTESGNTQSQIQLQA